MAQYVDSDYISKQEEHTIGGRRLLSSPFVLRGRNTNKPQCLFPAYVSRDPFFNSRPRQISIPFAWGNFPSLRRPAPLLGLSQGERDHKLYERVFPLK